MSGEEHVLLESTTLPDDYIMDKIIKASKDQNTIKSSGRVFIFPTLQMSMINYREDEEVFLGLLKWFQS